MREISELLKFAQEVADLEELKRRIQADYQIQQLDLALAGHRFKFTQISDPDEVFSEMEREAERLGKDDFAWEPYWAETWDSAVAVSQILAEQNWEAQQVLDLGCGLGITGSVAAALGARVVMADAAPPSLLFARLNSWPWRNTVDVLCLDWRNDLVPQRPFDLVIGSDILYSRREWPYLERFWQAHLTESGVVILGEPGRHSFREFPTWIAAHGWNFGCRDVKIPNRQEPVKVAQISRLTKP